MTSAREGQPLIPALGAVLLLLIAGAVGYLTLFTSAWLSSQESGEILGESVQRDLALLTLSQLVGLGLALMLGLHWFGGAAPLTQSLWLAPIRGRTAAACLAAGACLQFPLAELSNLLHHYVLGPQSLETQLSIQAMLEAPSLGRGILVVTCLVAAVPVAEELFFRGLLLFGLRARYGDAPAVLGSACLFGISHLDAVAAVYAGTAGLVLGALALRTRSIWPGIAVHGAVNAMPVLLPERLLPLRGFNVPSVAPLHLPVALVLGSLAAAALLVAWVAHSAAVDAP